LQNTQPSSGLLFSIYAIRQGVQRRFKGCSVYGLAIVA
jgi:hypothetical protein